MNILITTSTSIRSGLIDEPAVTVVTDWVKWKKHVYSKHLFLKQK